MMGGCVSSGNFERRQQANVFHVWNVDEYGEPVTPGHIEVTDSSLILYQKTTREAIIWPMRSLRRYGFDAELFSFESGRRCTTGPGVYAFKCRKAELLFNMLQERILSSGQDELSNHSGVLNGGGAAPPPPLPPPTVPLFNNPLPPFTSLPLFPSPPPLPNNDIDSDNYLEPIIINRSNSSGSQQLLLSHNYVNDIGNSYVNSDQAAVDQRNGNILKGVVHHSLRNGTAHSLDDETNYAKLDDLLKQEHQHLYMNVTVSADGENQQLPTTPPATTSASSVDIDAQYSCDHCYANVAPSMPKQTTVFAPAAPTAQQPQLHVPPVLNRKVNYAILDLRRRSRNNNNNNNNNVQKVVPTAPVSVSSSIDGPRMAAAGVPPPILTSSASSTAVVAQNQTLSVNNNTAAILEGYAKIDFDKTTALSNSINPTLDDDQAVRKTRHNSNASSMLTKRTSLAMTTESTE